MGKKVVLLALAGVMVFSVSAFAYGGPAKGRAAGNWGDRFQCFGPRMMWADSDGSRQDNRQRPQRRGNWRHDADTRVELPAEVTEKLTVLQRTHLEMRLALTEEEPDVDKARELFLKSQEIRNEIARWHFEQALDNFGKSE
ncbi:MAG: hypothetical protein ACLFN0_01770 [Thermovirgaceae bacterium]